MKKYKYELQKGSKHILCPVCQKKTFKPYVHAGTNNVVDSMLYGRCERINACGYIRYPTSDDDDDWTDYKAPKVALQHHQYLTSLQPVIGAGFLLSKTSIKMFSSNILAKRLIWKQRGRSKKNITLEQQNLEELSFGNRTKTGNLGPVKFFTTEETGKETKIRGAGICTTRSKKTFLWYRFSSGSIW